MCLRTSSTRYSLTFSADAEQGNEMERFSNAGIQTRQVLGEQARSFDYINLELVTHS